MDFFEKINKDVMAAMKAKEKEKLSALRAIKSELLLLKTSGSNVKISEADGIKVISKLIKQRKDSAQTYKEQNRMDLYEKEMVDVPYMEAYLPKQVSDDELEQAIKKIINETGATGMKDMGKVMGAARKQLAATAEGKRIADTVKTLLQKI